MSLHLRFSRKAHDRKASSPRSARRRSNRVRSRSFLPRYELMEDRTLLSTVNWVGSNTGGNWDVATNWLDATTGLNHVPTASDDAVVNLTAAGTVTLNGSATDTANSLTTNSSTSISIGGDSLSLASTSTIGGLVLGGTAANSSYTMVLGQRTFNNAGAAQFQRSSTGGYQSVLYLSSGALFDNKATGSFDFQGDNLYVQSNGG